jgi:hypothetical protein
MGMKRKKKMDEPQPTVVVRGPFSDEAMTNSECAMGGGDDVYPDDWWDEDAVAAREHDRAWKEWEEEQARQELDPTWAGHVICPYCKAVPGEDCFVLGRAVDIGGDRYKYLRKFHAVRKADGSIAPKEVLEAGRDIKQKYDMVYDGARSMRNRYLPGEP